MIAIYNRKSLIWGSIGLVLQTAGMGVCIYGAEHEPDNLILPLIGFPVCLIGTALLIVGMCYYAKAKALPVWYGIAGIWSWIGMLLLAAVLIDMARRSYLTRRKLI